MNILILLLLIVKSVSSSKILAVTIFPTYSHQGVYQPLWIELAERGHEVTLITSHPINNASLTNLKEIDYSFCMDIWKTGTTIAEGADSKTVMSQYLATLHKISIEIFKMTEVQDLVKNSKFDLVIAEWAIPTISAFSAVFKCPLIGINSLELIDAFSTAVGQPVHPVVHPNFMLPFKVATSFWERVKSVEMYLWFHYHFYHYIYPQINENLSKYLKNDIPSIQDILKNASFVFVNTNVLFFKPRSTNPNIIEFSGLHMKRSKPLPEKIKAFLDEATNGVIYFSLGSTIKSHVVPIDLRNVILETFKQLPYKVLWKFDDDNFTIPKNVKIFKWLPQQDVLAHKNVKVFITQGGLQSAEEAVRKRVPVVGLPFIFDQFANVQRMVDLGIGKHIDKSTITVDMFNKAIIEVAENNTYRITINKLADLLEDEPIKAIDKVVWAVEFVLRHKGAQHLRSPYLDYSWYQYYILDIIALVFLCFVTIILLIILLFYKVIRMTKQFKNKVE